MAKVTLFDLDIDELRARLQDMGQPAYRATQIWRAAFVDLVGDYEAMTTLPSPLRADLATLIPFPVCVPAETVATEDGRTTKDLLRLADDETVELVTMVYADRVTACVSSQVGCGIRCPFCATGYSGLVRDLAPGEIVAQVVHAARHAAAGGRRLSNVVFMGMGEPFHNTEAVFAAIGMLRDPGGLGLGARAITVSTAGVIPGIVRLAEELPQVNLAVSLHTVDHRLRDRLVPLNRKYPVREVLAACRRFERVTGRRVTFEVTLLNGVNDSVSSARALASALRGTLAHVNLIPMNATPDTPWQPSPPRVVAAYRDAIAEVGLSVTVRESRGAEIRAACGQLRARSATP
ncbi:MAG: 23S rRNA (adenine(2503)-C(2))-methyltransferase RlmN [Candidatus Bipolaricaulota bacterium]